MCGAYHAPALVPANFPPASADNKVLAGLPKTKVTVTWVPWTSDRLSLQTGYGAGVTAPGWYQHLFAHWTARDSAKDGDSAADVATTWLVRVARTLRREKLDASTASVLEASRLANALAAVRGRPSPGLAELDDAAQAVLCDGSPLPLALVHRELTVGHELGTVPDSAPTVPLAADLAATQRRLRLQPSALEELLTIDLRKPNQLARSVLLHRLALLGVNWGTPADAGRTKGTFKEAWTLLWQPELTVAVVDASRYGTTIATAAATRVTEHARTTGSLAELSELLASCLLADLPDGISAVVAVLAERTAVQQDVVPLLETVAPLARTCRYGNVRGVDVTGVQRILDATVVRACVGLPTACAGLDDAAATPCGGPSTQRSPACHCCRSCLWTTGTGLWPPSPVRTGSTGPSPAGPRVCCLMRAWWSGRRLRPGSAAGSRPPRRRPRRRLAGRPAVRRRSAADPR